MTRYLFALWDSGGTGPPIFGIARRLIARGHSVRVVGDATLADEARDAGCEFSSWRTAPSRRSRLPVDDPLRDWETRNPLVLFRRARDAMLVGPAAAYAADMAAELSRGDVDAVASDLVLLGSSIAIEKSGLPSAGICPQLYPFPQKGMPMIGSGAMPARGPLGRARDAAGHLIFQMLFDSGLGVVNQVRASYGLTPVAHTLDQMLRHQRVLVLSSPSFDFPGGHPPPHVKYAGAQLDDPSWATVWQPPFSADDARPLALVALSSTFQDQLAALARIRDALTSLPLRAIVMLGPGLADRALDSTKNVAVVRAAPHARILREAAVCISHCGHGTTLKALSAGVPLVCMPFGRDQGDNAARVVFHGAGVRLDRDATVDEIARAVTTVLGDARYRAAALRVADRLAAEAREDVCVRELEALVVARPRAA